MTPNNQSSPLSSETPTPPLFDSTPSSPVLYCPETPPPLEEELIPFEELTHLAITNPKKFIEEAVQHPEGEWTELAPIIFSQQGGVHAFVEIILTITHQNTGGAAHPFLSELLRGLLEENHPVWIQQFMQLLPQKPAMQSQPLSTEDIASLLKMTSGFPEVQTSLLQKLNERWKNQSLQQEIKDILKELFYTPINSTALQNFLTTLSREKIELVVEDSTRPTFTEWQKKTIWTHLPTTHKSYFFWKWAPPREKAEWLSLQAIENATMAGYAQHTKMFLEKQPLSSIRFWRELLKEVLSITPAYAPYFLLHLPNDLFELLFPRPLPSTTGLSAEEAGNLLQQVAPHHTPRNPAQPYIDAKQYLDCCWSQYSDLNESFTSFLLTNQTRHYYLLEEMGLELYLSATDLEGRPLPRQDQSDSSPPMSLRDFLTNASANIQFTEDPEEVEEIRRLAQQIPLFLLKVALKSAPEWLELLRPILPYFRQNQQNLINFYLRDEERTNIEPAQLSRERYSVLKSSPEALHALLKKETKQLETKYAILQYEKTQLEEALRKGLRQHSPEAAQNSLTRIEKQFAEACNTNLWLMLQTRFQQLKTEPPSTATLATAWQSFTTQKDLLIDLRRDLYATGKLRDQIAGVEPETDTSEDFLIETLPFWLQGCNPAQAGLDSWLDLTNLGLQTKEDFEKIGVTEETVKLSKELSEGISSVFAEILLQKELNPLEIEEDSWRKILNEDCTATTDTITSAWSSLTRAVTCSLIEQPFEKLLESNPAAGVEAAQELLTQQPKKAEMHCSLEVHNIASKTDLGRLLTESRQAHLTRAIASQAEADAIALLNAQTDKTEQLKRKANELFDLYQYPKQEKGLSSIVWGELLNKEILKLINGDFSCPITEWKKSVISLYKLALFTRELTPIRAIQRYLFQKALTKNSDGSLSRRLDRPTIKKQKREKHPSEDRDLSEERTLINSFRRFWQEKQKEGIDSLSQLLAKTQSKTSSEQELSLSLYATPPETRLKRRRVNQA